MELISIWRMVRRWWWLIVLPALAAFVLTLPTLAQVISPPVTYSVAIRFTAGQIAGSADSLEDRSYIPWLASEYAVINLAAWLRTDSFAQETAAILATGGQTFTPEAVRGAINADAVRSILTLYLSWPEAEPLRQIAEAASMALRDKSGLYFPQFSAAQAEIRQLDGIVVTPVTAPITTRLAPLLRALLGLIAGIGLACLAEYLDPRIRTRAEAERVLGLPVLSEIQRG